MERDMQDHNDKEGTAGAGRASTSASARAIGVLMLALPPLFWAGNVVVGRATRGDITPITLSFGRWVIALTCLLPFAWRAMARDRERYWQCRWRLLRSSIAGVVAFNSLVYLGLQTALASNGLLLNSFVPILIVLFGALFYRQRLRPLQIAGLAVSSFGVLTLILHGDFGRLAGLQFVHGDLIIFLAMMSWALYTLWLRGFPPDIDRVGLLGAQIAVGLCVLLPFFLWELAGGAPLPWNPAALAALLYVGIFPSVLAYLLYMHGVARVGAARAGLFIHLVPVYGAALAVVFLGEALHLYHAVGMAAIFLGLALSSRAGGRAIGTA